MKYELPLFLYVYAQMWDTALWHNLLCKQRVWSVFTEALDVLKQWNPNWKPPFFLSDFSHAEFADLKGAFPDTTVYECDFHREQAWVQD